MSRRSRTTLSHQGDLPPKSSPGGPGAVFGNPFGLGVFDRPSEASQEPSEKISVDIDKDGWFRESMARHAAIPDPHRYRVHPPRQMVQHIDRCTGAVCPGREEEAVRHLATLQRVTEWVAYADELRQAMLDARAADAGFYKSEQEREAATWGPITAALALEKPGTQAEVAEDE